MYLQVTKLRELLAAVIELACEGLDLLVNNLMGSDIASLSECLSTDLASVWTFACVPALMGLKVTHLREMLSTSWLLADLISVSFDQNRGQEMVTYEWFDTRMCPYMYLEMRLLVKSLSAVGHTAGVSLSRPAERWQSRRHVGCMNSW